MLDVIITVSPTANKGWLQQCRRSVASAIMRTSYPVNVIEAPSVHGHIGQAMLGGFRMTSAPYVAWVDEDDFVLPNAFEVLHRHFEGNPTAICAREIQIAMNGLCIPNMGPHHLTAWRRDMINEKALEENPATPYRHMFEATKGTAVHEMSWVYVYRIHMSKGLKTRKRFLRAQLRKR